MAAATFYIHTDTVSCVITSGGDSGSSQPAISSLNSISKHRYFAGLPLLGTYFGGVLCFVNYQNYRISQILESVNNPKLQSVSKQDSDWFTILDYSIFRLFTVMFDAVMHSLFKDMCTIMYTLTIHIYYSYCSPSGLYPTTKPCCYSTFICCLHTACMCV